MPSKAAGLGSRGERVRVWGIQLQSWALLKSKVFPEYSEGRGTPPGHTPRYLLPWSFVLWSGKKLASPVTTAGAGQPGSFLMS